MTDLEPIRGRVDRATKGPWVRRGTQVSTPDGWFVATTDDDVAESSAIPHDAELIAHAPTDLRDLIAEVERLREAEAIANRKFGICVSQFHKNEADHEALAAEVHRLRAQMERVREVVDRWEQLAAYRSAARIVREALAGNR